jgi:uncharacterized protein YtpQ (UPF0354 family)
MSAEDTLRALRDAEVEVKEIDEGHVSVRVREGLRARTATLDLPVWVERLAGQPDEARRAAHTAFARGVYAVLAEPKTDAGSSLTFEESARTVLPSIEAPFFNVGVESASGSAPFTTPFPGGLSVIYRVELDHGIRLLTAAQVAQWGCTADRLAKAALSILFHRSWDAPFVPTPETPDVYEFRVGDGLDGARALMMSQWDYDRVRDAALFSLPECDTFLFSSDMSGAGEDALRKLTIARSASSTRSLSTEVFRFERGHIVGT